MGKTKSGSRSKPKPLHISADGVSLENVLKDVVRIRQLKFECSDEFYKRVMKERLERDLKLQRMALRAFERYFAIPEWVHRAVDDLVARSRGATTLEGFLHSAHTESLKAELQVVNRGDSSATLVALRLREHELRPSQTELEVQSLAREIEKCLEQLPVQKLRLLRESLLLDLKYYRSARIKSAAEAAERRVVTP